MTTMNIKHDVHHDHDKAASENTVFGFWLYLMQDLILFGALFLSYVYLQSHVFDGPSAKDIFDLDFVFVETMLLLVSSCTFGFAMLALKKKDKSKINLWLMVTFLLGLGFIIMEIYEFHHLIAQGFGPQRSAFLSAFFGLVGTHGLHVFFGLIWIVVMLIQINSWGITTKTTTRLSCLSLFWHFLDIVWICVFSIVYLLGQL